MVGCYHAAVRNSHGHGEMDIHMHKMAFPVTTCIHIGGQGFGLEPTSNRSLLVATGVDAVHLVRLDPDLLGRLLSSVAGL